MTRPNGHELRSTETRARLVANAIEIFGRIGYDAASTRELAKQSDTNVSAITYHFGGKRELYLAAAEAIGDEAAHLVQPLIDRLDAASKDGLEQRLEAAVSGFVDVMLDEAAPRAWARFLARCTAEDDDAFAMIYDRALAPLQRSLVHAVATSEAKDVDLNEIRLRASSVISAVISFRLLPGIVLRGMDWKELRPEQARRIATMVRDLIRNGFLNSWEDSRTLTTEEGRR